MLINCRLPPSRWMLACWRIRWVPCGRSGTACCVKQDRVLIDDGWLVISSFNRSACWDWANWSGLRRRQPYVSRMFTQDAAL